MDPSHPAPSTRPPAEAGVGTAVRSVQRRWLVTGVSVTAVIAAGAAGFLVGRGSAPSVVTSQSDADSVERWWIQHHGDVAALRSSIADSQHALAEQDVEALGAACLTMHDDAVITLKTDLPAPDPEVTAELDGAIEDAHEASHMCLAARAGSLNNYAGEFRSQMTESDRQLRAVEEASGGHPGSA